MDRRAFERARKEFQAKTQDLSDEEFTQRAKVLVEQVRANPPATLRLLGVTYGISSDVHRSEGSSTLTFSSEV